MYVLSGEGGGGVALHLSLCSTTPRVSQPPAPYARRRGREARRQTQTNRWRRRGGGIREVELIGMETEIVKVAN